MAIIKCLLTIVLLFVISLSLSLQENVYRLPKHVAPHHYDIRLIPHITKDEGNFTFDGEASIVLEVFQRIYSITLHSLELKIDEWETKLSIYKKDDDVHTCCEPFYFLVIRHEYDINKQILTIHFGELLQPKIYKLYLKFTGLIKEDMSGFFKTFYIDNKGHKIWLAATFFEPVYARKAFPCWDEPAIKATFRFCIKHYPNYTALSNMPSIRSKVNPIDGKLCTHFETTPIMSTNTLGFVIADYGSISVLGGITKIWGPKHLLDNAKLPLSVAETAAYELERFTNSTVHVPKIDHVAIPQYPVPYFGSWGMIIYEQNGLLEANSLIYTLDNIVMIFRGLVHERFGNLVSPAWWDYIWLSKGISTYLGYYIANTMWKAFRLTDLFVARHVLPMLYQDSICYIPFKTICKPININITSLKDVNNAFSDKTYTKSGALLRMVSHLMREDVFQIGLIKYLQKHKYSSVTPDDLWEALQDALDESDVKHNDFKIKEVMDTWFNQSAYPVVKIDRDYDSGKIVASQHKRVAKQRWNIIEAEGNNAWWIPLNYITKSNLNFSSTLATHWLIPHRGDIIIEGVDNKDWIIVNKQLTGYYRVNYDITNWKRIAAFLNSEDYDKIPILNRAQIIDDVYYMMETEGLDFKIFFNVIKYLWREIDFIAWYPALRVMQALAMSYMKIPQSAMIFKPYFFNLTHKLFEHISFDDQLDINPGAMEIKLEFTKFTCLYDIYPQCRKKAIVKLYAYMEDPIANKISSNQEHLLCFGLMQAKEYVWNDFLKMLREINESSTNVKFLGCSENLDIIEKHFNILKENYSCIDLFLIMFENLPINVNVINFIINHYEKVAAEFDMLSQVPVFVTDFHRKILNYFTEEDIEKVKRLVQNRTIFLNNEYLNDRIKKLNKINDNLSKVRDIL